MEEKKLEDKIKKWKEELEKLLKKKTEIDKKIEDLNGRIAQGQKELEAEKNKKIIAAMEEILGPLDEQKLDDLRLELMIFAEEKSKKDSEISDQESSQDDYFEIDGEEEDTGE